MRLVFASMFFCFSSYAIFFLCFFFFQAEDGIRDTSVTGVQTCALPIWDGMTILPEASANSRPTRRATLGVLGGAIAAPYVLRSAQAAETVNVGVVLPLSGANAQFGINSRNGIELAADQINKAGGIKALGGAKIELVVADATSTPTTAATVAQRLVTQ